MKKYIYTYMFCFFCFGAIAQQNTKEKMTLELDSICSIYIEEDRLDDLLDFSLAQLNEIEEEYGDKDTLYAMMSRYAALAYLYGEGNTEKGIQYLEIAAEIEKNKPSQLDYVAVLNELGDAFVYLLGNLDKGLLYYQDAQKILEKDKEFFSTEYISTLVNIAGVASEKADFDTVEKILLQARQIIEEEELKHTHPQYVDILSFLGNTYYRQGKFEEAAELSVEAVNAAKKINGENSDDYKSNLHGLLMVYIEQKDYVKGAEVVKKLKNAANERLPFDFYFLNTVATFYTKVEKYKEAAVLFALEKKELEKIEGTQTIDYAQNLFFSGELYMAMLDFEKAEKNFKEALAIRLEHYGTKKHPHCLADLNNLIRIYIGTEDWAKAQKTCLEAMYLNTDVSLTADIKEGWGKAVLKNIDRHIFDEILLENFQSLFQILEKEQKIKEQVVVADLVIQLIEKIRDKLSGKEDKLRLLKELNKWVAMSLNILDRNTQVEKAFELAEVGKMALLLQAYRSDDAYAFGDLPKDLIAKEETLQKQHTTLRAALLEQRPEVEKDSLLGVLNDLNVERTAFKKHIEQKYPKYNAIKYACDRMTKVKTQGLLDDKTALLEYVIRPGGIDVFCITKENIVWKHKLLNLDILHQNIEKLHQTLSDYKLLVQKPDKSYQNFVFVAHWCYQNLLKDILEELDKDIENLIIVTDGKLGHLPFETFLIDAAPQSTIKYNQLHYLCQDYKISYNYSAGLLLENKKDKKAKAPKGILGMAANYDWSIPENSQLNRLPIYLDQRKRLSPLEAAREEVVLLQEGFEGDFLFDEAANEAFFKENASQYDVIHLAMHGLLDARNPMLSSMAFTENGDSLENNFLQAHEISKMKLNASLVVLSACETGYGKFEKGNGIASLARSFAYAGVPAMVVSLWQVNDQVTGHIMTQFYDNLTTGMTKDEALQDAKLRYIGLAEGLAAHPAYWSPFIMVGNTQAISLTKKTVSLPWIIGAGSVLILLLGVFIWNKRKEKVS